MIVKVPYGDGALAADLRGQRCRPLQPEAPRGQPPRRIVGQALEAPSASSRLEDRAADARAVTVVVPDATRKAWLPEVLPEVLARVAAAGVSPSATTVLVACGTHPAVGADRLAALLGPLPDGVAVEQHDARDASALRQAGRTASGLDVRLNRRVVDADLLVTVSTVQHHYFAGFGGGRKMIFPGVAGYEEIQANHARVIDLDAEPPRRHPGCEPGVLDGNPLAEEIAAAAALREPDLSIALVAGADGRPAWAAAGDADEVFAEAVERARAWYEIDAGPFERMVVSAGGRPVDRTLIQAHKMLDAAARFCRDGAEIVFAAACEDGPGSPAMAPFLDDPRPEAIIARLSERYVQYGHTTLRLLEKTARFRIAMATTLPDALVQRLGMAPVHDLQARLDGWRADDDAPPVGLLLGGAVYPRRLSTT